MENSENLVLLTADIVSAHVANNATAIADLPRLIASVHQALSTLGGSQIIVEPELKPAVAVRNSVHPDHIICLEDGAKLKMLKRHLMTHHQMTTAEYRAKWNLKNNYPMVAPEYAEMRKALAIKIGLGTSRKKKLAIRS